MMSDDGQVMIAFNGEIYNAFDLRPQLEAEGYRFRSDTDTEVVLSLYLLHGQEYLVSRLNGMFAICIVDLRRQVVTLTRDRLGIKPLYIGRLKRHILFASEVKSFLQHPAFQVQIAPDALDEYLNFRYCAGGRHLLDGVEQLEPGHWMVIPRGYDAVATRRYWSIPDMATDGAAPPSTQVEQFAERLELAVKRQLLSDVKLGCQLSGGIDSSLVNIFASKHAAGNLDAFSIVLSDPAFSEGPWIDQAAHTANVVSHCFELGSEYFAANIEHASWHLDQPLNHPNSLGLMCLAEHA